MDWKHFFIVFVRNVIITLGLSSLSLGMFGLLLAGWEGFVNMAIWGLVLGLMAVPMTAWMIQGKYWSDFAGRYSQWWVKKETEGDE
jgi:hypothetical protein